LAVGVYEEYFEVITFEVIPLPVYDY
jgi:hypothetical protein